MVEDDALAPTMGVNESDGLAATVTAAGRAADASRDDEVPTGAARFERGVEIGRGGMGVVYAATDRQFNREVALKQLRAEARDAANIDRFAAECLITGNLSHPGIPPVYERGRVGDVPFYAMERVRGQTLKEAIESAGSLEKRLTLVPAIIRVAQTLAYAHSKGVIHRDIKPSNIVVGAYGETFVLDWGIAKVRGLADTSSTGTGSDAESSRTRAGAVIGTPAYMSPEQAAGRVEEIDERTDVFALGALLYHLLVGRPPYDRGSADDAIEQARKGDFEPIQIAAPKAPGQLRAICERAMAERSGDRFRSAADVAAALEEFTADAVAHRDAGPIGWVARVITVLTGLLAVVSLGVVAGSVPTLREQGWGAYVTMTLTVLGLTLSVLDYKSRGAYRLSPLILALAGATLLTGIAGATTGINLAYSKAMTPTAFDDIDAFRGIVVEGSREAIGNVTTACSLTVSQLFAWAIARRRARG